MNKTTVKNSTIFMKLLERLCEIESERKSLEVAGVQIVRKRLPEGKRSLKYKTVNSLPILPYLELRKRLDEAGLGRKGDGRKAILSLDQLPVSGFSTGCLIDGLVHALRFESERDKTEHLKDIIVDIRRKESLHKNPARMADRSMEMLAAAMSVNPSVTAPYLLAASIDRRANKEEISANEITKISRNNIRQSVYGCIKYSTDKLNTHPPPIELLVVVNLTWLFWHWPITAETYPTAGRPPKKQPRGPRAQIEKKPHRDITANILNVMFPETYNSSSTIKDNFVLPKGAVFCGW